MRSARARMVVVTIPAPAERDRSGLRARACRRADCEIGWQGTGAGAGSRRPTRRWESRRSRGGGQSMTGGGGTDSAIGWSSSPSRNRGAVAAETCATVPSRASPSWGFRHARRRVAIHQCGARSRGRLCGAGPGLPATCQSRACPNRPGTPWQIRPQNAFVAAQHGVPERHSVC